MRSLSPEEERLWRQVTATIRPLSREVEEPPTAETTEHVARDQRIARAPPPAPERATTAAPRRGVGKTLDGSWDKRLRDGAIQPDRVLDLHGLNLDRAWQAIDTGLERAFARGDRLVLLVTGHHRPGEPPVQRGKIRAAVDDWLAASRHAGRIAAVRAAHRRHGGGGSLYLILRRPDRGPMTFS